MVIKVTRKDGSSRVVLIMPDEKESGKYAFVNLTTHHICRCRFDSVYDAFKDLINDNNVTNFEVIKEYEDITPKS